MMDDDHVWNGQGWMTRGTVAKLPCWYMMSRNSTASTQSHWPRRAAGSPNSKRISSRRTWSCPLMMFAVSKHHPTCTIKHEFHLAFLSPNFSFSTFPSVFEIQLQLSLHLNPAAGRSQSWGRCCHDFQDLHLQSITQFQRWQGSEKDNRVNHTPKT